MGRSIPSSAPQSLQPRPLESALVANVSGFRFLSVPSVSSCSVLFQHFSFSAFQPLAVPLSPLLPIVLPSPMSHLPFFPVRRLVVSFLPLCTTTHENLRGLRKILVQAQQAQFFPLEKNTSARRAGVPELCGRPTIPTNFGCGWPR